MRNFIVQFRSRFVNWFSYERECLLVVFGFPALAVMLYVGTVKQLNAGGTPIVFDLSGNGIIDITGHNSSREKLYTVFSVGSYVEFDIFGTGTPIQVDWIEGGKDAFLVDLRNGIPEAASGVHLFAAGEDQNGKWFENGFEKLATLDTNSDGSVNGNELEGLALWRDDGDAIMQSTEILELSVYEISSIPTKYSVQIGTYGLEQMVSYVDTADGQMYIEDIWFLTSDQPTQLDGFLGAVFHPFSSISKKISG